MGNILDANDRDLETNVVLILAVVVILLREKWFDHQVHAVDAEIHWEVPVFLLTVQDGSMMDKTGRVSKQRGKLSFKDISIPFTYQFFCHLLT